MARETELIFRGSNRSVIRALDEIASKSSQTTRKVRDDNVRTADSFKKVGDSAGRIRGSIAGLAGMVGFGGLAIGIKDVVQGGMQLQAQQAQLKASLQATGQTGADSYNRLREAAEKLSTRGGFSTTENLQALTAFIHQTHSASAATTGLALATNIARSRNMGLADAQKIVSQAYAGSVGRLQRILGPMVAVKNAQYGLTQAHKEEALQLSEQAKAMGKAGPLWLKQQDILHGITPQMRDLATLQDKHATTTMVLAAAQRAFAGATSAYANTTAGKLNNVKNAEKNLTEAVGQGLLPIMNKLISITSTVVVWLTKHRTVLYGLLAAVAAVTTILTAHAVVVEVVKAKTYALQAANLLLGTSFGEATAAEEGATVATAGLGLAMDTLPVLALITGLVLIATHFKQVKRFAVELWHGIETTMILIGKSISGAASGIWNALTWPFRKAWNFIKGVGHGISNIVGGVTHTAGSILSSATFGLLHSGGTVRPKYFDMGGPVGTDTIPGWLSPGEGVLNAQRGMPAVGGPAGLNALNSGQTMLAGPNEYVPIRIDVRLPDGRLLAQLVTEAVLKKAARGPSSLVGGSIMTGTRA